MNPTVIFWIIFSVLTFDFLFEQILNYINLKNQTQKLPAELSGVYEEDKFAKSQEYQETNVKFGFVSSTFNFVLILIVLFSGALGCLDEFSNDIFSNQIYAGLLFFGILFLSSDILHLPLSIYRTFVIEEKFGFNKITPKVFALDKIKGYILTIIVGGIILGLLLWLIEILGQNFWIWFWIAISIFMVFINMFYTSLIVPIFNKLKPLEEGELRSAIEEYSKSVSFPLTNIFVIDGSKRSTKANAYFSGIGSKKKIVLFDTLINNHTKEELVAVLAHEVGHFKKKHIILSMILSIIQTGIILFILSLFVSNPALSQALGTAKTSLPLNLIAFSILFTPISHIVGIFMNIISRKNEYEADRYAAETYNGTALQNALKKLSANNLSNLTPHPAYVFVHYSHPPLLERLRALAKI